MGRAYSRHRRVGYAVAFFFRVRVGYAVAVQREEDLFPARLGSHPPVRLPAFSFVTRLRRRFCVRVCVHGVRPVAAR
jgi:hypothetical protein